MFYLTKKGYVYVPTTWAVAIIFFGVTLQMRKIITVEQVIIDRSITDRRSDGNFPKFT